MNSQKFFEDDGDNTVRINYDLNESSIVLDLGSYKGEFAEKIYNKYKCYIYGYEPIKEFYDIAVQKFINNNKIKIKNYGLGTENKEIIVENLGVATSILNIKDKGTLIAIKDIYEEFKINNLKFIDLMKINIEGAEYYLLKKIIDNNLHKNIKNIQIQFHQEFENTITRNDIQQELKKTHILTYNYEYVWENWSLKSEQS